MLLLILVLGLAGTAAELLLLQHYEDGWQIVPIALVATALAVLVWHAIRPGVASVRVIQALMMLFVAAGPIGMGLHYTANAEFEREMDPSLGGGRLFLESLSGAMPALAPGIMVQLGLIGLVYTYKHPIVAGQTTEARRDECDA
jgi:hypothetical protein